MGKYLKRALKFYVFLLVLIALVIVLLALVGYADLTNINTLFRNGYNAVWEIALIFLAVALIYPKLGFGNRDFTMRAGSWEQAHTNMLIAMGDRGYKLESEDALTFTFRKKWFVNRLAKYTEDRITITLAGDYASAEAAAGAQKDTAQEPETLPQVQKEDRSEEQESVRISELNRYPVNIEGLTKDVVRIVSALYRVQSQSAAE